MSLESLRHRKVANNTVCDAENRTTMQSLRGTPDQQYRSTHSPFLNVANLIFVLSTPIRNMWGCCGNISESVVFILNLWWKSLIRLVSCNETGCLIGASECRLSEHTSTATPPRRSVRRSIFLQPLTTVGVRLDGSDVPSYRTRHKYEVSAPTSQKTDRVSFFLVGWD
jgi:hypothetical protein